MNQLPQHFRRRRHELGLSLVDLARMIGYQNVTKGCNRIARFEERGEFHPDLLDKLRSALDIDESAIEALIEQDHRDLARGWHRWASEPIKPHLVVRMMPAVYLRRELPEDVKSPEEAEGFAAKMAREWRRQVCLVWSRRLSVWFDETGEVYARTEASPEGPVANQRPSARNQVLRIGFGSATSRFACDGNHQVCLVWSRRHSVFEPASLSFERSVELPTTNRCGSG